MTTFRKILADWKITIIVGLGIVVLAFFLRTYNLNSVPIFADEAIYVRWAQVMRAEPTLRFLPMSDGKQPLFMWSVMPMFKLFADPLIAGRMVSVLTGIGTLVGIFTLSYLIFNSRKAGLFASFLYAISPYAVFFDRMALVDSMLAMWGVWTFVFLILTAQYKRLDTAMIAGFTLGVAYLTKSPALFFIILIPTTIVFAKFSKEKSARTLGLLKLAGLWLVTVMIGYGMYNLLRLGPNFHIITSRNQDYVFPITHILDSPLDPLKPFINRSLDWLSMLGPSLLWIFMLVGVVAGLKKKWLYTLVVMSWALFPIVVQAEFAKVFTARYIYFTLPYLFMLAGLSILTTDIYNRKIVRILGILIILLFTLQSMNQNYLLLTKPEAANLPRTERYGYLEEWTSGTGIYESSTIIREQHDSDPDTKIVVGTEGFFGTLPDGLQAYLNDLRDITVIGVGLNIDDVPDQLVESRDFGNKTYLVVNSTRLLITEDDFAKRGLEIVGKFVKADRPSGTREFDVYGPREYLYLLRVVEPEEGIEGTSL